MTKEQQEKPSNTNLPNTVPDRRECVSISAEGYLKTNCEARRHTKWWRGGGRLSPQQNSPRGSR
ncbi:hypothetical protein E2C01_067754 [Portunus trituberculatus]|uniref:Uncharacterized protein n=1 Tax=Portunus trituberculatus TaxID=210409 RepID=A0A5B7HUM9_PORTR|nr:hypothetical protein [Portunus trituberculatus]